MGRLEMIDHSKSAIREIFSPLTDLLEKKANDDEMYSEMYYLREVIEGLVNLFALEYESRTLNKSGSANLDDLYEMIGQYARCIKELHSSKYSLDYRGRTTIGMIYDLLDHMTQRP